MRFLSLSRPWFLGLGLLVLCPGEGVGGTATAGTMLDPWGSTGEDYFGSAVAVDGDLIVVGALAHDGQGGTDSGAVYCFRRGASPDVWNGFQKISPAAGAPADYYGGAVAISGTRMVVGATQSLNDPGKAYVYEYNGASWVKVKTLTPFDGGSGDSFGVAVDISAGTVIIGSVRTTVGAAYIYRKDQGGTNNWGLVRQLLPNDADTNFGSSVALESGVALVGSNYSGVLPRSVLVFDRNSGGPDNWGMTDEITPSGGVPNDLIFGQEVAISTNAVTAERFATTVTAWVGAPSWVVGGHAYRFERPLSGGSWTQAEHYVPFNSERSFGNAIAVSGTRAAIGHGRSYEPQAAGAYLFRLESPSWFLALYSVPPPVADNTESDVDISGNTSVIGMRRANSNAGAAYVVTVPLFGDSFESSNRRAWSSTFP